MLDREGKNIRAGDIIFVWGSPETGSPEIVVSRNRILGIEEGTEGNFVPLNKFKVGCGSSNLLLKLSKREFKDCIGVFAPIFAIKGFKKYLDKKGIRITKDTDTVRLWCDHMYEYYGLKKEPIKTYIIEDYYDPRQNWQNNA